MPELPPPPPPPMSIGEAIVDLVRRRRPPWLTSRALAAGGAGLAIALAAVVALGWAPARQAPPEIVLPRVASPSDPPAGAGHDGAGGDGARAAPAVVSVHAAGGFARPGLYELPAGARVARLLEVAGGPVPDAAVDSLNLAAKLNDGERVYLPRAGEQLTPTADEVGGSAGGGGVVDLNAATLSDLDALPGVGPSTAQAILDYRREHGRFGSVDELLEVRGIGEAKLEALRSRVRV